jgi:hypothetical protein
MSLSEGSACFIGCFRKHHQRMLKISPVPVAPELVSRSENPGPPSESVPDDPGIYAFLSAGISTMRFRPSDNLPPDHPKCNAPPARSVKGH